jgi:hypothetical protein
MVVVVEFYRTIALQTLKGNKIEPFRSPPDGRGMRSLCMLGTGLIGLAGAARRKFGKKK